jgi:hypothetical protein
MSRKRVAVMDIETTPFKWKRPPTPFLVGYYDGEVYLHWNNLDDFVAYVREQDVTIYAHNGGKFDFLYMVKLFEPYREIRLINGRVAQFQIGTATFRDSICILPMALREYKKDEISFDLFEDGVRDLPVNRRVIIDYNRSDCVYLFELVTKFRETYGAGLTLATSALSFWKKQSGLSAPDSGEAFHAKFSPFYFGGRVEAFFKGIYEKNKIKVYDINSAYPFAMRHPHPWGFSFESFSKLNFRTLRQSFIHADCESIGAFPATQKDGSTYFPNDGAVREFRVSGHEFEAALDAKKSLKYSIRSVYTFKETITFEQYIDHFYKIKKASPKGSTEYIFAKLMLVSLYGKFGANPNNYQKYVLVEPDQVSSVEEKRHPWAAEKASCYRATDNLQPWTLMSAPLLDNEKRFYNVATAASITGFQRAVLFRNLQRAQNPLYCDTDSIHCEHLPCSVGTELGQWNIEYEAKIGAYAGKKLYALSDRGYFHNGLDDKGHYFCKIASKGAKLKPTEIEKIARGGEVRWQNDAPSMSLKRGMRWIGRNIKAT